MCREKTLFSRVTLALRQPGPGRMEPFGVTILFCLLHISHHGACHRLPQTSQRPSFPLQVLSTLFPSALPSNLALEPWVFIKEKARKRQPRGVDGSAFTLRSQSCWPLWSWPRFDFISSAAQASSVSEVYFRTSGYKRSKDNTHPTTPHQPLQRYQCARKVIKCQEAFLLLMSQHHINSNNKHIWSLACWAFWKDDSISSFKNFYPKVSEQERLSWVSFTILVPIAEKQKNTSTSEKGSHKFSKFMSTHLKNWNNYKSILSWHHICLTFLQCTTEHFK